MGGMRTCCVEGLGSVHASVGRAEKLLEPVPDLTLALPPGG